MNSSLDDKLMAVDFVCSRLDSQDVGHDPFGITCQMFYMADVYSITHNSSKIIKSQQNYYEVATKLFYGWGQHNVNRIKGSQH